MNTMSMPGFTAEASLYKTNGRYRFIGGQPHGGGRPGVIPQLRRYIPPIIFNPGWCASGEAWICPYYGPCYCGHLQAISPVTMG
jgi:hypothetical protein